MKGRREKEGKRNTNVPSQNEEYLSQKETEQ